MRPRSNVAIRLANDAAWGRPFIPAEQLPTAKLVQEWSAVSNHIYIWDYNINFTHYLAPMPNMDIIAANIRFWVKNKAEGIMTQGGWQGTSERDRLRAWVIAKLMWDPSLDEGELTNDFIWGYYGKAAPALASYDALLRQTGDAHRLDSGSIHYPMDASFLSREFIDGATASFERAKQLAAGDAKLLHKVERAELSILYVKAVRGPEFVGGTLAYAALLNRFEQIARREGALFLQEGAPDLDVKLAAWRKQVPSSPDTKAD
jgi:hypothetical protein